MGDNNKKLDYETIKDYYKYTSNLFDHGENSLINRANVLIVANSILLGGSLILLSIIKKISIYSLLLFIPTLIFSLLSILFSVSILRVYPPKKLDKRELMHFRVVEKFSPEDFYEKVINLDKEKVIELYTLRIKATASFMVKRYRYLYYSYWFFRLTIIFFLLFSIIIILLS